MFDSTQYLYITLFVLAAAFIAVFLYFWLQHRKYVKRIVPRAKKSVFFEILVPKENTNKDEQAHSSDEKKQLVSVAEQIFTTLSEAGKHHGLFGHNDYISFEIAAVDKKISFYINCSEDLKDLIEKQIHA